MIRMEEALGVPLRKANAAGARTAAPPVSLAPGVLGSDARPGLAVSEDTYLTLRPSFGDPDAIYAYRAEICWDAATSSLIFRDTERLDADFAQQGTVSVPHESGYVYLVTNRQGQDRLVIVSRPTYGEMFGIMTTLQLGRGNQLVPVSAAIAYVSLEGLSNVEFGRIPSGHPCYEAYRRYLNRTVEEQFARFLPA